jgi:hypothetical protein
MNMKRIFGGILTVLGIAGLIYAGYYLYIVQEVNGYQSTYHFRHHRSYIFHCRHWFNTHNKR